MFNNEELKERVSVLTETVKLLCDSIDGYEQDSSRCGLYDASSRSFSITLPTKVKGIKDEIADIKEDLELIKNYLKIKKETIEEKKTPKIVRYKKTK